MFKGKFITFSIMLYLLYKIICNVSKIPSISENVLHLRPIYTTATEVKIN